MFADDQKIHNKSFNHDIVQIDINNMLKWSSNWCLYLNTNKCSVLHSGEKNTDCDYFMSIGEVDYKINNSQLVKDLGVTFDPKLNFNHHIYEITHKATNILGILKQTFLFFNKKKTFLLLYKSLIRPHLEHANIIWYPKYKSISVERVQRRATKILMENRQMTYTQRLEYLDLPSLWHRRLRGDMIQVFKIINGIDDINWEKFFGIY